MLLPDVAHLVHQRVADVLVIMTEKAVRVQAQLMVPRFATPERIPIGCEVPGRMRLALIGDEDVGNSLLNNSRLKKS